MKRNEFLPGNAVGWYMSGIHTKTLLNDLSNIQMPSTSQDHTADGKATCQSPSASEAAEKCKERARDDKKKRNVSCQPPYLQQMFAFGV